VLISHYPDQEGNKVGSMFRGARDFNNTKTPVVIKFFLQQGKAPKEIQAILTGTLVFSFLVGLRTYQHPCTMIKNRTKKI